MAALRSRTAALVLAALFVTGQAALFTHQLLVPHQLCAEHDGELIHVEASRAAPVAPDAPAWMRAQTTPGSHGHEHCTAFASRREDALTPPAPPCVNAAAPATPKLLAQTDAPALARDCLLRLAPKNSPPV